MKTKIVLSTLAVLVLSSAAFAQTSPLRDPIVLPKSVLQGNCTPTPNESAQNPVTQFDKGICLYQKGLLQAQDGSGLEVQEKAAAQLQLAQSLPLGQYRRSIAGFFEGLAHCQITKLKKKAWDHDGLGQSLDGIARGIRLKNYCGSLKQARVALSAVDWKNLWLTAPDDSSFLQKRLDDMTQCFGDTFAQPLAAECGLLDAPDKKHIEAVIDSTLDQIWQSNSSVDSNFVLAMFSKKSELVLKVQEKIKSESLPGLQENSLKLNTDYIRLNNEFLALDGDSKGLIDKYKKLAKDFRVYQLLLSDLQANLLKDPTGKNLGVELDKELGLLKGESSKLSEYALSLQQLANELNGLKKSDLSKASEVKTLCKVYFCGFLNESHIRSLVNLCQSGGSPVCPEVDFFSDGIEPDSIKKLTINADNGNKKVLDICATAGVDAKLLVADMSLGKAETCFVTQ
jgi:hypothetical protein